MKPDADRSAAQTHMQRMTRVRNGVGQRPLMDAVSQARGSESQLLDLILMSDKY